MFRAVALKPVVSKSKIKDLKWFLIVPLCLILSVNACKDEAIESKIPKIEFNSVSVYKDIRSRDSMVVLQISYEDGNGDIGLSEGDTFPPFNYGNTAFYNLFVSYYVKTGNVFQKIVYPSTSDTIHFNQRFPTLNFSSKEKKVSGIMDLRIPASPYPGINPTAVKFRISMLDKSLNHSNEVESGEIALQH